MNYVVIINNVYYPFKGFIAYLILFNVIFLSDSFCNFHRKNRVILKVLNSSF